MLHHGTLVRITHDHSYVEELVDSGQITADEARTHPSRSIITRALGSDPDMYADHFSLEVSDGDRVILCSDGLSSMIPDSDIEAVAVSSATPQQAADNLVGAALTAGGSDNVTALVVDILNDGVADATRSQLTKRIFAIAGILLATVAVCLAGVLFFIRNEWYLGVSDGNVAVYQGVNADLLGLPLYDLVSTSAVATSDLPTSVQDQLEAGIRVQNQESAQQTLDSYSQQISDEKSRAQEVAVEARSGSDPTVETATPTDTTTSDQSEGD
jgi:protein phosphatase